MLFRSVSQDVGRSSTAGIGTSLLAVCRVISSSPNAGKAVCGTNKVSDEPPVIAMAASVTF